MNRFKLVLFFTVFYCVNTYAQQFQPGYIVKIGSNIMKGLVAYDEAAIHTTCTFKADENAEPQIFKASQLEGYGFESGKSYVTKKINVDSNVTEWRSLELLHRGDVSLFKYFGNHFIEKHKGVLLQITENGTPNSIFESTFNDCAEITT
jgi:hypothetical protein